ncbi:MAG: adenine deaminase, partial [Dehalococcoidia bacterium]|nr:adenine deaminase [Dehalococcoidia bacterium]
MGLAEMVAVGRGSEAPDLLLANARIVNVFNGDIEYANVAIHRGRIVGVGDYKNGRTVIDLKGDYLAPGLINGHTHIESSMLHPLRYAEAVVPRGTTTVVTDLHEIVNVCGIAGIKFVDHWANEMPLDIFFMLPSCVPATNLETSGAEIGAAQIARLKRMHRVIGLGEMMNYPGVIGGFEGVLEKIRAMSNRVIDGHAPGISGKELNAYVVAGIRSDHECTRLAEASEKLRRGMYIMIREGSSEKNLEELLPLVTDKTYRRCMFVVDDRSCSDLLSDGDIDAVVRKAIKLGLDPVRAVQLATINPAEHFRLYDRGAVAPGYVANLITLGSLERFEIKKVFYYGQPVADNGVLVVPMPAVMAVELTGTVKIKRLTQDALQLRTASEYYPVIQVLPGQIVTRKRVVKITIENGIAQPDVFKDLLKLVVVERHKATGNVGVTLVKGFGLKHGAIASSVAHDSHNIVAVGVLDDDIIAAVREVQRMEGGLAVCSQGKVLASLPLPVAGLLSPEPLK